ncbi:putative glycoside hydrolase family 18 protein [Lyophyllum shimeji]|uniref:Glycoside hydrolase family 18 protein n=1 Tax=Lyophyllum shimeji TaxID=47721 RepID=A0A9P3UHJ0_LYOSH|nr:putative glycoside hydrolase family 18 protein [Lyophyllum shimeji]
MRLISNLAALATVALPALGSPAGSTKVATAWYAGWHSTTGFPLSNITWSKYTHLTYAFAETTADVTVLDLSNSNPELLPKFVSTAHQHGVKALVSIGGWTGSRFWSSNVATATKRTAFVKTVAQFAKKYNLDGLDFDWEYPNNQGIGCNAVSPSDTANFLAFIQLLRADPIGKTLILSVATATVPFLDANGNPSTSVAGFSKVLDWIAIMNYDIWGPWSPTVGPNAPLDDSCAAPGNQAGSAVSAVKKWVNAGIPSNQLVLGVPGYGHSFRVRKASAFKPGSATVLAAYPTFDSSDPPVGDAWDDAAGVDVCGNQQPQGGVINFWGLIQNGFLNEDGTVKSGMASSFDTCSQTPYVYNPKTEVMVSYDNAKSFTAKGSFIKAKALKGFAMWEAGGDHNNILINSIRAAAGF